VILKRLMKAIRGPQMEIQATVIRADGTVEKLGKVASGRVKFKTSTGGN
jgi:hypothetical protein